MQRYILFGLGVLACLSAFALCVFSEVAFNLSYYRAQAVESLEVQKQAAFDSLCARDAVLRSLESSVIVLDRNNVSMQNQNERKISGSQGNAVSQYNGMIQSGANKIKELSPAIDARRAALRAEVEKSFSARVQSVEKSTEAKLLQMVIAFVMPVFALLIVCAREFIIKENVERMLAFAAGFACQGVVAYTTALGSYARFQSWEFTALWAGATLLGFRTVYLVIAKSLPALWHWFVKSAPKRVTIKTSVSVSSNQSHAAEDIEPSFSTERTAAELEALGNFYVWLYAQAGRPSNYGRKFAAASGLARSTFFNRLKRSEIVGRTEAEATRGINRADLAAVLAWKENLGEMQP